MCVCVCVCRSPASLPLSAPPITNSRKMSTFECSCHFSKKEKQILFLPPPFPGKVIRELVGFDGRGRGGEVEGGGGRLKGFLAIFYLTVAVYEPALFCAEFFLPLPERRDVWGWGRDHSGGVRLTR